MLCTVSITADLPIAIVAATVGSVHLLGGRRLPWSDEPGPGPPVLRDKSLARGPGVVDGGATAAPASAPACLPATAAASDAAGAPAAAAPAVAPAIAPATAPASTERLFLAAAF